MCLCVSVCPSPKVEPKPIDRSRSKSTSRVHSKKSVWPQSNVVCMVEFEGVIYCEVVPNGRAVDADLYSQQLERVHGILRWRYPALVNWNRVLLQQESTAVGQAVAWAPVTQRARVRSSVGTSFLGEVFSVFFFSPVRQMSGSFRPPRFPNIVWPSLSSLLIIHYGRQWFEMLTRPKNLKYIYTCSRTMREPTLHEQPWQKFRSWEESNRYHTNEPWSCTCRWPSVSIHGPFLAGKNFENIQAVEVGLTDFFTSNTRLWYHCRIINLVESWRKTIESDCLYFED